MLRNYQKSFPLPYLDSYRKTRSSLVGVIDGKIVGFLLSRVVRWINGQKRVLWLEYMAVGTKYRRKGIASLLLKDARRYAKQIGVTEIFTTLNRDNEPSKRLLESAGYTVKDWRIATLSKF